MLVFFNVCSRYGFKIDIYICVNSPVQSNRNSLCLVEYSKNICGESSMLGTGFAERKTSNDQSISILHRISVTQSGVSDCDIMKI